MSGFLNHASEIFDAASAAPDGSSAALTILIHSRGQIHIVDGAESPIDSLQAQHGCATAFRVTRDSGKVRVEGRNGSSRCVLEDSRPSHRHVEESRGLASAGTVHGFRNLGIFRDQPLYSVVGSLAA